MISTSTLSLNVDCDHSLALGISAHASACAYALLAGASDMNPPGKAACWLDAAVFSPHKFVGGPGAAGVLVVKRHLLTRTTPAVPGEHLLVFRVRCLFLPPPSSLLLHPPPHTHSA